ncbi:MAG: TRAP transporter small permease [Marinosulfonomonas sp.]|nr:TRAP transporter small permease [Marinosulfonomonas sp.]
MTLAKSAEQQVGRWLHHLTRYLAYGGGVILAAIAIMTVVSVIGRYFLNYGLGPVKGDFELVEMGCAIAIFAFMPLAQMKRAHVTVDIFIQALPQRAQCFLGLVGDFLIAVASGVILWRFWLGFGEKFPYGSDAFRSALGMGSKPFFPETTYELELPIWIPYSLALIGAFFFALVSLYTVWRSLNWTLQGQEQTP